MISKAVCTVFPLPPPPFVAPFICYLYEAFRLWLDPLFYCQSMFDLMWQAKLSKLCKTIGQRGWGHGIGLGIFVCVCVLYGKLNIFYRLQKMAKHTTKYKIKCAAFAFCEISLCAAIRFILQYIKYLNNVLKFNLWKNESKLRNRL